MNQIIEIYANDNKYHIEWALSEHFEKLKGKKYMLNNVSAEQIEKLEDLSSVAKLLLSAVAGAVIQYLIDNNHPINDIFENGYLIIK